MGDALDHEGARPGQARPHVLRDDVRADDEASARRVLLQLGEHTKRSTAGRPSVRASHLKIPEVFSPCTSTLPP